MDALLADLEASGLGQWMRASAWAYPLANTGHVIGAALLLGPVLVVDLRAMGLGRSLDKRAVMRLALPIVWCGFALAVISGLMMFAADPRVFAATPYFQVKLALIALAGLNALAFHWWNRRMAGWARLHAALSPPVWIGVIFCGRMIAYW